MIFKKSMLLIIVTLLIAGCLSIVPTQTQAQLNTSFYLPLITKNWPHTPIFGVAARNFSLLPQAETAGAHWVRINGLVWADVQPNSKNEWLWDTALENNLIATSQAGMETILIVRTTPAWARLFPDSACGPIREQNFIDFANFMKAVVNRYSAPPYNVSFYEIWNEPDGPLNINESNQGWGCWGNPNDPYYGGGYYANMLKTVYPAIKATNPFAQVVIGGLLLDCDPRQPGSPGYCATAEKAKQPLFLEGVLRNGGGAYFDILNLHGYNYYAVSYSAIMSEKQHPSWSANGGVIQGKLDYAEGLLSAFGVTKPIMFSETGLLFDQTATADFQQKKAEYVVWLYSRNMAEGILATTWYTLDGPGWRNSGLLDASQSPLPAFFAFQTLTQMLDTAGYIQDVTGLPSGIIGFEFNNGKDIWVLFSEDGSQKTLSLPGGIDSAYDLYGNPLDTTSGQITFSQPVYITFIH